MKLLVGYTKFPIPKLNNNSYDLNCDIAYILADYGLENSPLLPASNGEDHYIDVPDDIAIQIINKLHVPIYRADNN